MAQCGSTEAASESHETHGSVRQAALDLDGIVVGNAHRPDLHCDSRRGLQRFCLQRHAAQLLVSKGYSGLEAATTC